VARLAFFNVLEGRRQQSETGCAKSYRGLPVTTISLILPPVYCMKFLVGPEILAWVLHGVLLVTAVLFILDISVPKPDWKKILTGK
jgi:CDP-diacylglycerol--serine O-phosphatidyltransferase